jgi:transaldolase
VRRPCSASTGGKGSRFPTPLYVTELAVANVTVNTMPEDPRGHDRATAQSDGDQVTGNYDNANAVLDALDELGISVQR